MQGFVSALLLFCIDYSGVAFGFIACLIISLRWFIVPSDQRRSERLLVVAIYTLIGDLVSERVVATLSQVRPLKYDLYIYKFDEVLGSPGFRLGHVILRHPRFVPTFEMTYTFLPIPVLILLCALVWRNSAELGRTVRAFIVCIGIAPLFYLLIPVCGPRYAFASFPVIPAVVHPHPIPINAPPNAVPSVHTATVLLVAWFSRKSRFGGAAASGFLALTVVTILASGEHYLFDVIAAIPYAFLCVRVGSRFGKMNLRKREQSDLVEAAG